MSETAAAMLPSARGGALALMKLAITLINGKRLTQMADDAAKDVRKMLTDQDAQDALLKKVLLAQMDDAIERIETLQELMGTDPVKAQKALRAGFFILADDHKERLAATFKDNAPDPAVLSAVMVLGLYFKHFGDFCKALTELRDKRRHIQEQGVKVH